MAIPTVQSRDPRAHAHNIEKYLYELRTHCREDVPRVKDPRAQALFETTADVLGGLEKAFHDFEVQNKEAWRKA